MPYVIDNTTWQIIGEVTRQHIVMAERMILRQREVKAYEPGGPWYDAPVEVRIANMQAAKHDGAYADAVEMVERGYAIGAF